MNEFRRLNFYCPIPYLKMKTLKFYLLFVMVWKSLTMSKEHRMCSRTRWWKEYFNLQGSKRRPEKLQDIS